MDSLSQLGLGAACSVAVMGRRTAVWKAALWGGIAGTLPDLDALIDFGDAVSNMTHHRAESQIRAPQKAYERNTERLTADQRHDPAKAPVPPYFPDTPVVRHDIALPLRR